MFIVGNRKGNGDRKKGRVYCGYEAFEGKEEGRINFLYLLLGGSIGII